MSELISTADIALLALSGAAGLRSPPKRFFLDTSGSPMSTGEMVDRLTSIRKPVAVRPVVEDDGLRVITGPVEKARFGWIHADKVEDIASGRGFLRFLAKRYSGSLDGLAVICRGAGAEARTTVAQFYSFQREYVMDCENSIGGRFSDEEGVAGVVNSGAGGGGASLEPITPAA